MSLPGPLTGANYLVTNFDTQTELVYNPVAFYVESYPGGIPNEMNTWVMNLTESGNWTIQHFATGQYLTPSNFDTNGYADGDSLVLMPLGDSAYWGIDNTTSAPSIRIFAPGNPSLTLAVQGGLVVPGVHVVLSSNPQPQTWSIQQQ